MIILDFAQTINNKIICKPYSGGKELKSQVKSGFATIQQKQRLVGLEVLLDAIVTFNNNSVRIPAGSMVYFNEEQLFVNQGVNKTISCDYLAEEFSVMDASQVIFVTLNR
jgi:hypothetical protein